MAMLPISQVAKRFGVRSSALRYYEEIGLLPEARKVGGQRQYDPEALRRLAVIQRAREVGFSLKEIQELLAGFDPGKQRSQNWRQLTRQKCAELDAQTEKIRAMQTILQSWGQCGCQALDHCGEAMLKKKCGPASQGDSLRSKGKG